jgi:three-Cys-motif partner protein
MVDREFGEQHTDLKLSVVEKYLSAFSTALSGKFRELWYIDAFAGTGSRTIKHKAQPASLLDAMPARIERRRGSAKIAIDVRPAFDFIVFIEKKPAHYAAMWPSQKGTPRWQNLGFGVDQSAPKLIFAKV